MVIDDLAVDDSEGRTTLDAEFGIFRIREQGSVEYHQGYYVYVPALRELLIHFKEYTPIWFYEVDSLSDGMEKMLLSNRMGSFPVELSEGNYDEDGATV